jgi:hypothetical protein
MNTNTHTAAARTALLAEVLQPRQSDFSMRCVHPADYAVGSPQDRLVSRAAAQVRRIYVAGKRNVRYDEHAPELFFDECADTHRTAQEVEQCAADDQEAAIALAVFERAGWFRGLLQPTTLASQVEIQLLAMNTARQARLLFAQQQTLAI